MANPIRRLVQLILDRSSAKKTEVDAKQSMGRIETAIKRLRTAAGRVGDKFRSSWKKSFKLTDDGMKDLLKKFKDMASLAAFAFGARALVRFTGEMFRLGTAAEETGSKFDTVFGAEAAATLDAFIDDWGRLAGLTKTEGREMAAVMGAIAQGMGLSQDASAQFSAEVLKLAGDLQSFNDIPIAETFAAIRSGVTGETEPLKRLGIVLKQSEVNTRALLNTGKLLTKELTNEEVAAARLEMIVEKAGVAIGDLERTQGSTANTARRMSRQFRQLKEDLAIGVLPVMSLFINAWTDITDNMTFAQRAIKGISNFLVSFVGGVQILAVELNAHIRTSGARLKVDIALMMDHLATFIGGVEWMVNRIRSFMGKDEVDWTSGLRESAARLRSEGEADIVAFRALVEEETEKILRAANVIKDAPSGGGAPVVIEPDKLPDTSAATAAAKLAKDLAADAESLTRGLRTPQEVYEEEIFRLAEHLEARRITQETFARAVLAAQATLQAGLKALAKDDADAILGIQQKLAEDLRNNRALSGLIGEYNAAEQEISLLTAAIQKLVAEGLDPQDEALTRLATRLRVVRGENEALKNEQETMQAVASTTAEVLNAAFGAGVGQMAAGKAKQNAIMAAEQTAIGLVAMLNPLTVPKAAGHFAAAGQFAGIAAAWGALAGTTGGFSSGSVGGGGGGGGRDIGGAASQRAEPLGPELNIYFTGEGFDAVNPRVQRVVYTAMAAAQSNIGDNARVRTFRGNIPTQGGG